MIKNPPANAGDKGSIPGLGRSPGGGHSNHSSILAGKKHMNGGGLGAKVHGVPKSQDTTEVTSCITH